MNLDDIHSFTQIDPGGYLAEIDGLPQQLQTGWEIGQGAALPAWTGIRQVVIAGMGGSAISADLLAAYVAPQCITPVIVHRDYDLPAWAQGTHTLLIASSHSGNTEETLSALETARRQGCRCLTICTGGELARIARLADLPLWIFHHTGQPRAAVGLSFGLQLAALSRLDLIPDPTPELASAIQAMQAVRPAYQAETPVVNNLAKRMAGQLMGRWVTVFGAGLLAPVARRWKGQINELAKAVAQFEILPEADHNTLAGVLQPEELLARSMALFLRSPGDHPRNRLRSALTRQIMMLEGMNTDFIDAQGDTPLAQQWTCLLLGDYIAYYLAMGYGIDPNPITAIADLKMRMQAGG